MSDLDDSRPSEKRRIVTRSVTLETQSTGVTPVAVCPRRLRLLPVEECGQCSDFVELVVNPDSGSPYMRCAFDDSHFIHPAVGAADLSPLESTEPPCIADLMSPPARCVRLDDTLNHTLLEALADADFAPVLDETGRALGLVTKADVLARLYGHGDSSATVREMTLSSTFVVGADASIGQVSAVMAYERMQHVLVVDASCRLVGTVSALDLARWLACRCGYVVPARRDL